MGLLDDLLDSVGAGDVGDTVQDVVDALQDPTEVGDGSSSSSSTSSSSDADADADLNADAKKDDQSILDSVGNLLDGLGAGGVVDAVDDLTGGTAGDIVDGVENAVDSVTGEVDGVADAIGAVTGNGSLVDDLLDSVGAGGVGHVVDDVTDVVEGVVDDAKDVANGAIDSVGDALADAGVNLDDIPGTLTALSQLLGIEMPTEDQIVDLVLPDSCDVRNGIITMAPSDVDFTPIKYSEERANFYGSVSELPDVRAESNTGSYVKGGAVAGIAYFGIVMMIFGAIMLLVRRKYWRGGHTYHAQEGKKGFALSATADDTLENDAHSSKRKEAFSRAAFGISMAIAVTAATVLIVGLVKVHRQTDLAVDQLNEIADKMAYGNDALTRGLADARTSVKSLAAAQAYGTIGCVGVGEGLADQFLQAVDDRVDEYYNAWNGLPAEALGPIESDIRSLTDEVDGTSRARQTAIAALSFTTLVCVLLLALQYVLAYTGANKSQYIGTTSSLLVGFMGILAVSAAFGLATTAFLAASDTCDDPDGKLLETYTPEPGMQQDVLKFFMTCDDANPMSDALWQASCYSDYVQNIDVPGDLILACNVDEYAQKLSASRQSLVDIANEATVELSCSSINPMYTDLMYGNLCGDATDWLGAIWLSAAIFGLAVVGLVVLTYSAEWNVQVLRNSGILPNEKEVMMVPVTSSMRNEDVVPHAAPFV
jgi:hypothetical protein